MSGVVLMFLGQLGIFAWAIVKVVRGSYDTTEVWRKVSYLFVAWAFIFIFAFCLFSGLETDLLGCAFMSFLVTAGVTIIVLQRI